MKYIYFVVKNLVCYYCIKLMGVFNSNYLIMKIKNNLKNIWVFLFKKNLKKSIAIIILILIVLFFINKRENQDAKIGKLETGNIEEIVSASGIIEAVQESSLAFEKSGRISKINVKVGDIVYAGQNLASLSSTSDYGSVLSAEASLDQAMANLEDVKKGASFADINLKQDLVNSAKSNLENANNSFPDTIDNVYASLNDILKNKLGDIFTNNSGVYTIKYNACDQNLSYILESDRNALEVNLKEIDNLKRDFILTQDINTDNTNIDNIFDKLSIASKKTSNLLNNLNTLFTSSCALGDNSLNDERNLISSTKTSLSSTISNINTTKSQILSYRNSYSSSLASLNQLKAGATAEKIKSLEALVDSARANLLSASGNNNKNFITAPFSGIVTKLNINLGEISSPNYPAISLMSVNNFEMKIKLAEIDAVKIKLGAKVKVVLDTYGDSFVFSGVISQIDPTASIEGNISNYYAKISFEKGDKDVFEKIKIGMNGTANIIVNQKENVNYIDAKYIKVSGSNTEVKVIKDINKLRDTTSNDNDKNIEIRNILIGIRGDNGKIEVLSGINEDDNLYPIGVEVLDKK